MKDVSSGPGRITIALILAYSIASCVDSRADDFNDFDNLNTLESIRLEAESDLEDYINESSYAPIPAIIPGANYISTPIRQFDSPLSPVLILTPENTFLRIQ